MGILETHPCIFKLDIKSNPITDRGKLRILHCLHNQIARAVRLQLDDILDEACLCYVEFDKPDDISLISEIDKVCTSSYTPAAKHFNMHI